MLKSLTCLRDNSTHRAFEPFAQFFDELPPVLSVGAVQNTAQLQCTYKADTCDFTQSTYSHYIEADYFC